MGDQNVGQSGRQKRRVRKSALLIAAVLLIIGLFTWYRLYQRSLPFEVAFLPAYGDINVQAYADNRLGVYFLVKNADSTEYAEFRKELLEPDAVVLDGLSFPVAVLAVNQVLQSKAYAMEELVLQFSPETAGDAYVPVEQILLNGQGYPLGKLSFLMLDQMDSGGSLKTKSQTLYTLSNKLDDFNAGFKNTGNTEILVTDILLHSYPEAEFVWGEAQSIEGLPFPFQSGAESFLSIRLTNCQKEGVVSFYVAPILQYSGQGTADFIALYHALFGIPQTDREMMEIAHTLFASDVA